MRGGRRRSGMGWRGPRRGSVVVLAALLMTMAALVIGVATDLSRLMAMKNELQTVADAAALGAVTRLGDAPDMAKNEATALLAANRVTAAASVMADSVRLGVWDPAQRRFLPPPGSVWTADAVRVVASAPASLLFGPLIGMRSTTLRAVATGWQAPVEEAFCVKPWFILAQDLMAMAGKPGEPLGELEPDDVRKLRDTVNGKHYGELNSRDGGKMKVHAISLPAFEDGGTGSNSGAAFRASIPKCHRLKVGWTVAGVNGEKVGPTVQGAADFCQPLQDDICYNGKGGIGIPVSVPVFDVLPGEVDQKSTFVVKGLIGFMFTGMVEKGPDAGTISGYVIGVQGAGGYTTGPSTEWRPMLVR